MPGERSLDLAAIGAGDAAATLQRVETLAGALPEACAAVGLRDGVLAPALDERDMPQSGAARARHTPACDQNSSAAQTLAGQSART